MKIAILVTGQIRSYDSALKNYSFSYVKTMFEEFGHTVDLYGVHWNTCPSEKIDKSEFQIILELKNEHFEQWILSDIKKRANVNSTYSTKNKHLKILEPENMLISSKYASCQLYTFGKLLHVVLGTNDDYDIIIRWRWDIEISDSVLGRYENAKLLVSLAEILLIEQENNNIGIMTPVARLENQVMFPDDFGIMFTMNTAKKVFLNFPDIESIIDTINEDTSIHKRYHDVSQWRQFYYLLNERALCDIPRWIFKKIT